LECVVVDQRWSELAPPSGSFGERHKTWMLEHRRFTSHPTTLFRPIAEAARRIADGP
jgi:hypothetical protein